MSCIESDQDIEINDSKVKMIHEEKDLYKENLEFRRWIILFNFAIVQITNGGAWATYIGITTQSQIYYKASFNDVLWLANVFLIVYLSLSFLGSWLVYKYFAFSFVAAAFFSCLGGWFRVFSQKNIILTIFSQLIISISQIFILETPSLLADRFFHSSERLIATSVGVYSNYIGLGLGYLISPLIVGNEYENISLLLLTEAIILTVPFFLSLISIKDKPKKPANLSSTYQKHGFISSLKSLAKNSHYLVSMLCFSIFLGNSWTLLTILDSYLNKDIFEENQVGYLGLAFIFAGSLTGLLASLFLELKTHSKRFVDPFIKFFSFMSTVFLIILSVFVNDASKTWIFLINSFLGVGIVGLTPFACLALVETSFPVQESISINVFYFFASIFSFFGSNIATIEEFGQYGLFALVLIQAIPMIYLLFFYKSKFLKTEKEGKN